MVTILRKNKVTLCEVYVRVNGATPAASLPAAPPGWRLQTAQFINLKKSSVYEVKRWMSCCF